MQGDHMNAGLVIFTGFLVLTITRSIYHRSLQWLIPLQFTVFTAGVAAFSFPLPYGPLVALGVVVASGWFAWSSRVPFLFREWSYQRLTGQRVFPVSEVPESVWSRPRLIRSWWPDWL